MVRTWMALILYKNDIELTKEELEEIINNPKKALILYKNDIELKTACTSMSATEKQGVNPL